MVFRPASLDEERIELANAAVGRWMPARVRNMSYSDYFNVMCPLMCSEAVCDYFKKLGLKISLWISTEIFRKYKKIST